MRPPQFRSLILKDHLSISRQAICAVGIGLWIAASLTAHVTAAPIIWDGDTSVNFTDGNNWVGGAAPANTATTDTATFNDPTGIPNQPTLDANRSVLGLDFTAGGWTLGGTATLTIGAGGISTEGTGTTTINAPLNQSAASTWNLGTGTTLVFNGATTLTAQPLITGAGNLVKGSTGINTGTSTTISGNNTYTGTTTIRQGTVNITGNVLKNTDGAFGNASSAIILGDAGTLDSAATSPQNAANVILQFNGAGATLFSRDIDSTQVTAGGRSRIAVSASGAANVEVSGNLNFSTSTTHRFEVGAAAGKTLTFSGLVSTAVNSSTLLLNGSNFGTGTVRFTNPNNTFSGGVTVVNGFLSIPVSVPNAATSAIGSGAVTIGEGATPTIGNATASPSNLTNVMGMIMETADTTFAKSITLTGGASGAPNNSVLNAYLIAGTNTAGTVSYTGNISSNSIANGDINLNLRSSTGGTVAYTGIINDNGDGTRTTFVNINQVANIDPSGSGPGSTNGAVFGGTVILSGANTYQGGTYVRGGTVLANNTTGSGTGTGAVSVLGGTFGGTGAVTGAVTVNSGAILAPGGVGAASIESLGTGALTMNAGSTFSLEINSSTAGTDLLSSSGNLTLSLGNDVALNVTDSGSFILTPGTSFTFLTYSGTYNGGLFTVGGVPIADDTGTFTVGANSYHIDYNAGGGHSVALVSTSVPEPGSAVMALGGLGVLLGWNRRRRV